MIARFWLDHKDGDASTEAFQMYGRTRDMHEARRGAHSGLFVYHDGTVGGVLGQSSGENDWDADASYLALITRTHNTSGASVDNARG